MSLEEQKPVLDQSTSLMIENHEITSEDLDRLWFLKSESATVMVAIVKDRQLRESQEEVRKLSKEVERLATDSAEENTSPEAK